MPSPAAPTGAPVTSGPLTISSLTLGRVVDERIPPVPAIDFGERVAAAAQGGFGGIGLSVESYREARAAGWTDAAMRDCLARWEVALTEVEFLREWLDESQDGRAKEDEARRMVEAFGVDHVNAGLLAPGATVAEVATAFAALCRRLAPVKVAFEFMPFATVATVALAREVIDGAGPNAGLVLDAFHWAHSHAQADDLDGLAPDAIVAVQLCDVRPPQLDDLLLEARHFRQVPTVAGAAGQLAAAVHATGAEPAWSVEAMSDTLRELPPAEMCTRLAAGARAAIAG